MKNPIPVLITGGMPEYLLEHVRTPGYDFRHIYGDPGVSYVESGLMEWENGRVRLTESGFPVSNVILAELLADLL